MRTIRGGMGLGDAIYVQAVARHLVARGERVRVMSAWPDVFKPLNGHCEVKPFTRNGIDTLAHYTSRKSVRGSDQWQDVCFNARVPGAELKIDWQPGPMAADLRQRAAGKPILLTQLMRAPMGRADGFGASLLPDAQAVQVALDRLRDRFFVVQVGSGRPLHALRGLDLDLAGKTTVSELIDAAYAADAMLGYVSFFVPLAEALGKPALFIWSRRGLNDPKPYVRQITPEKILHRKTLCRWVMDDVPRETIERAADGLVR